MILSDFYSIPFNFVCLFFLNNSYSKTNIFNIRKEFQCIKKKVVWVLLKTPFFISMRWEPKSLWLIRLSLKFLPSARSCELHQF